MSQQQSFGSTGSTGSGIQSLEPNNGAPVSGSSVSIVGMPSKTSQVVDTANVGGELQIENRALMTRYVVIDSDVPGERGTYETIQDAIDAAVADGCTIANQQCGLIYAIGALAGFTIPTDSFISVKGVANSGRDGSLLAGTTITSRITVEPGSAASLEDLTIFSASDLGLVTTAAPAALSISQCSFFSGTGYGLEYIGDTSPLRITNSAFLSTVHIGSPDGLADVGFVYNSNFAAAVLMDGGAGIEYSYCSFDVAIQLNLIAYVDMFDCDSNGQFIIAGTSTTSGRPCRINNLWIPTASSAPIFNFPGIILLGSVNYQSPTSGVSREISDGTGTLIACQSLKGNVTTARTVLTNYAVQNYDQFLWCFQEAPIAIQLSPGFANNQEITIKDRSFTASTNNITITVAGGLIEGAASLVMNQDGQCVRLKKFDTDYYLI